MALCPDEGNNSRVLLISAADSELNATLQASGRFEIVTDKSKVRTLRLAKHFQGMGFLRASRSSSKWRFECPYSRPGTVEWRFLKGVTDEIKKLLHADGGMKHSLSDRT